MIFKTEESDEEMNIEYVEDLDEEDEEDLEQDMEGTTDSPLLCLYA